MTETVAQNTRTAVASPTTPANGRIDGVAFYSAVGVSLLLIVMLARVVQLQVAPGSNLTAFMGDRITRTPQAALRGDLRDLRGRMVATTHFGYRVFVDPTQFPSPPGEALEKLANAIGMPLGDVAKRVVPKIEENVRREALRKDADSTNDLAPVRYVTVGKVLEDGREEVVKGLGVPGVHLETRSVREYPAGSVVAGLLGRVGIDHDGLMGAELLLNKVVAGVSGQLSCVRDARGKPLWVHPGGYKAPERGDDVRLSFDLAIQGIADEELRVGVEAADAAGGRAIVLDPITGEILAMTDVLRPVHCVDYSWEYPIGQEPGGHRPRYRTLRDDGGKSVAGLRNRCVEDAYEPGSTFKPFMWSETVALGLASPNETIDTEGGHWRTPYGRPINDVVERGHQTVAEVLINSSNIGMAKITSRMGFDQMRAAVLKFGFGSRTNIGLPGESTGLVTSKKAWSKYSQTSVAMGHEVAVTPLQMVRGFAVFARSGELAGTLPPIRLTAIDGDHEVSTAGNRVLPRNIAELTRQTMSGVTENLDRRLSKKADALPLRYQAFGKSGTAEIPLGPPPAGKKRPKGSDGYYQGQYNASFICGAPLENPRIVVLVVIDDPGPGKVASRSHYGAATAGPVARRIVERTLTYLQVPPSYPDSQAVASERTDRH